MNVLSVVAILVACHLLSAAFPVPLQAQQKKPKVTGVTVRASSLSRSDARLYMTSTELMGGWSSTDKNVRIEPSFLMEEGNIVGHLKVSGVSGTGNWNYAGSPKFVLLPGMNYRMTAWVRVDSLDVRDFPPILNLVIWQDKTILTNNTTNKYDPQAIGEWQLMTRDFSTPQQNNLYGSVALSKGSKDVSIGATIHLQDLRLELVE